MSTHHPANRLAQETSPYLLQHAHNPVDWFPWGEEAFAKARAENKPVFLSVGYSACHWCHVMERESFENEEIASLLNQHYVCIKVDREERPDVDQIYMTAVQLITHRGGWPMSVFMTPEGKPFYGGTYWPPTSRLGMPGFKDLVMRLHDYWVNRKDEVDTSAEQLVQAIQRVSHPDHGAASLTVDVLQSAMQQLIRSADRTHGGFGGAPKFPHPMDLRVLLRCWQRFKNNDALLVARLTLEKMANGGLYDHLGGGFHRYSTDAHWLVPHFEKMLYDNALLVPAYLEMYQISGEEFFANVVRETLDYVLREMTQPEGGFYSTQDADSEGEEGKFFVWTEAEINSILGEEEAEIFGVCYDVSLRGNWEGHNILNRPKPLAASALALELPADELKRKLQVSRQKLFAVRQQRIAPGRDDKVLTAWNGMMIAALSQAAQVLNEPRYAEAAVNAVDFIQTNMLSADGRLLHSYKDRQARFMAYLDDYSCLIDSLTHLYEATGDGTHLDWAAELTEQMIEHYADLEAGGFFYTANDHEQLIARTKDSQDNATPSGNGMAATALFRLGELCSRSDFTAQSEKTLEMLSGLLAEHPRASGQALMALDLALGPSPIVVIIDGLDPEASRKLKQEITRRFMPNRLLIHGGETTPLLQDHFQSRPPQEVSTAYVCFRGTCMSPVSDVQGLQQALNR